MAKKEVKIRDIQGKPKGSKFFTFLILALIVAFAYFFMKDSIVGFLKTIPWLWNFIQHMIGEIGNKTYLGLLYLAFFSGLFFIILPVEGTFILYLASGREFFFVIPIVIVGYVAGLFLDYIIGFLLGKWIVKKFLKGKFEEKKIQMKKTGGIVLLFSNIFPLPMPWIALVYGAMRYKLKTFLIICLIGQAVKFNLLYLGIQYLKPYYEPLWQIMKGMLSNFYEVLRNIVT